MKKPLIVVTTVIVLVTFVGALLIWSYLDDWVASGVRTLGPRITQTKVDVDSVKLSPSTGTGTIKGLVVGNPAPYQEPFALRLGEGTISVDPASLTGNKVVVKTLQLNGPEITFEGGLQDNNLKRLLANMDSFTATEKSQPASGSGSGSSKKLQVDEISVNDAKVHVKLTGVAALAGAGTTVVIPNIRITGLGTGPDGITPAEVSKRVLDEVVKQVGPAVAAKAGGLNPAAVEAIKGAAAKSAGDALGGAASQGLDALLKKKK
ncbi:MAG: hypothetical protein JNL10_05135 [Verrucomicrobiales bacterium]|nr:hypothetical protein [Verrucomicrobiales bacterium]